MAICYLDSCGDLFFAVSEIAISALALWDQRFVSLMVKMVSSYSTAAVCAALHWLEDLRVLVSAEVFNLYTFFF